MKIKKILLIMSLIQMLFACNVKENKKNEASKNHGKEITSLEPEKKPPLVIEVPSFPTLDSDQIIKIPIIKIAPPENIEDKLKKEVKEREELEEKERIKAKEDLENKRILISYFSIEKPERVRERIISGINSTHFSEAEKQIGEILSLYEKLHSSNSRLTEFQKGEISNVLHSILTEEGLIKNYVSYFPKLENFKFKEIGNNSRNKSLQKSILIEINKSLHILKNSYSPSSIEKAELSIEQSIKANELLSQNIYQSAYRLVARITVNTAYITGSKRDIYNQIKLSSSSAKYFDLNLKGDTYENYSIIDLSNNIAKQLNKKFTNEYLLHADLILKEAEFSNKNNDANKFEIDLDRGWAFVNFITNSAKGVASGVYQVVYLSGVYTLAAHPIDSTEAIANAIYDYDHIWNFIVNKIYQNIGNFAILNTEEKAKLITESANSLATRISPRGLIKSAVEIEKIARASHIATARIVEKYSPLIPPNGYTPLVSGSLIRHEAFGGCLIQKHVGLSDTQLKQRAIDNIKINDVSSFENLNIAEQVISSIINQNRNKIDNWLQNENSKNKETFISQISFSEVLGRSYNKNSDAFKNVSDAKVVLIKDSTFPEGYRILTGFPAEK